MKADSRLTVEVHGLKTYVVFVRDSEPIWRLEVVGEQPISRAVGTVGQSLQNVSNTLRYPLTPASAQAWSFHDKMVLAPLQGTASKVRVWCMSNRVGGGIGCMTRVVMSRNGSKSVDELWISYLLYDCLSISVSLYIYQPLLHHGGQSTSTARYAQTSIGRSIRSPTSCLSLRSSQYRFTQYCPSQGPAGSQRSEWR
jgi:hypothetical protein